MATIDEQKYATEYTGLISTASLALGFIGIFTIAFETFSRLPRKTARKKRPGSANDDPSVEDYLMAYLYRPRQFLGANRPPPLPKYPFAWVWQVLRLSQDWYLRHSGLDAAVYVRFVTGCWYFMLSQLCTTLIITLPLHIIYAPDNILPSSIAQASVSSLINSTTGGRSYLWVRTVLLWWQSICWIIVIVYVGWGNIRMRREQVIYPWTDIRDGESKDSESAFNLEDHTASSADRPKGIETKGWRFRTVKVSNIPGHMRDEAAIRNYLDTCLNFLKSHPSMRFYKPAPIRPSSSSSRSTVQASATSSPASPAIGSVSDKRTAIDHVVIVRKLTELHGLVKKRREVLHELESAHVALARDVMNAVAARVREQANRLTLKEKVSRITPKRKSTKENERRRQENIDLLVDTLGGYLPAGSLELDLWKQQNPEKRDDGSSRTIWEAMSDLPQESLDAYQPVTKLKFFHGQIAPSIDLYLTKLNLLTSLIEKLRTKPDAYAACDTAFVTFKQAADARLVKTELSWIRARGLTCRIRMAPDARDLDWDKLVEASFRGDMVRAFITHAAVWLGTFFWILPISALIGLVSLDNLSTRIPALANWLSNHAKAKSLASTLIPTVIVTITNMLIPTIMIQVSGRAQTFVTFSKLHHATWCRYWKWVVINVVIAFCIGTAFFTSLLGIYTGETFSDRSDNPLEIIANSFSNGAVFFVSYTILVIATQCFFELAQFMIPWFLFLGVRKATTPRQRFVKTEGRRFFSYTVGPNHTLIIAIILVFSLLNPLPICFVFLYFSFATLVFRDHFARLYWRVYYEQYGRMFYTRLMRFSLDALVLGQVVNMSLFFVLKNGKNGGACAALIPITIIIKLVLTRWYDFHMDAADAAYADVISGQAVSSKEATEGATDERENHAGRRSRRHTVNTRLKAVKLPELSLRATLNFPLAGRSTLKAKHGPQAVLQRLTQHLRDSGAYSELQDVVARDITTTRQEATEQAVKDLAGPSAEKTLEALENPGASEQNADSSLRASSTSAYHAKVLPHPKLRRDDRPDPSAPYIDPYLTEPLERYLWLPRDPLFPIDLDDTIEWYGRALVSSEGGSGLVGCWISETDNEGEESALLSSAMVESPVNEPEQVETINNASSCGTMALSPSKGLSASPSKSPLQRRTSRLYSGTERIRIPEELKSRYLMASSDDGSSRTENHTPPLTVRSQRSPAVQPASPPVDSTTQSSSLPRSMSAIHTLYPPATDVNAADRPTDLRRVRSEILDPLEKRRARRATILSPSKTVHNRDRSTSGATMASRNGEISQSRALAHEAIAEERTEAVARRKQEDELMQTKAKRAKRSWTGWFFKAPDDAD